MNTDKILAESIAKDYAPKASSIEKPPVPVGTGGILLPSGIVFMRIE